MATFKLPKVIYGTSGLGNLYTALADDIKKGIIEQCINSAPGPAVFDSAGKYGAGLALETLGKSLKELNVKPDDVIISNKLGWLRTELKTEEPTFEPGVWKDLKFDAVQKISYDGILECYAQGNDLLNGYKAELISVHDPDEYINAGLNTLDKERRYQDILEAYRALAELKAGGKVKAIGVGAKDWRIIQRISQDIPLDWVMIANSMTIHSHPPELVDFMKTLSENNVAIINSAVFNGGFLTGLDFYNYQPVSLRQNATLYHWREFFYQLCQDFNIKPAAACVAFGLAAPGVKSIALNTTNKERVFQNIQMAETVVPTGFWDAMISHGMIDQNYANQYLLNS